MTHPRRPAKQRTRRALRLVGVALCCGVAAVLISPNIWGWKPTVLSRDQILEAARVDAARQGSGGRPLVAKYGATDLAGNRMWVVETTSLTRGYCSITCVDIRWSSAVVPDKVGAIQFSWADQGGPAGQSGWPASFDAMADEAAPSWWPFAVPASPFPWILLTSGGALLGGLLIVNERWRRNLPPPAVGSQMSSGAR